MRWTTCTARRCHYKFKYKVSGCPNDCMNSVRKRADLAVIGTWRDDMKVDQAAGGGLWPKGAQVRDRQCDHALSGRRRCR